MALQASFFSSSSSSSSFSYQWPYDVFISFRGSDTRFGFTGNLYEALEDKGIHTFFDDDELKAGDEIKPALVKAIQESRIAIVVFSADYASSAFCLDELATIMEYVKGNGRLVWPIFYDVNPCDVRHQRGKYGDAMAKHKRFNDDKVPKWRNALHQAANLSGKHFKSEEEYEYVFIKKIVKEISIKINRLPLHIANYPVGLEYRVQQVNSLLNDEFDGRVLMVGIFGSGGIGKTTLARAVYNFIADQFEGLCFLEKVREKAKQGLVHLQEMLLSEMLGEQNIKLGSVSQGIPIIQQRLHHKKFLLVLDDVDNLEQLQAMVGAADWFGSGSRVIITTRDEQLLVAHGIERKYEVEAFNWEEALDLLSWNAFRDENIDPSYKVILEQAVTYACGLPLALEVIGSNLRGKSIKEWRSALCQYKSIPDNKIQGILKVSFDALDECHQKIFLDICCFNYYHPKVECILHARHEGYLEYGIGVLVQKSLIKIDWHDHVPFHDLIRDMGREIIRQESPKHPGKRSRLWLREDVVQVLKNNTGSDEVEIMILDASNFEEEEVEWDGEAFKKMTNLEVLIIKNARFSEGAKHIPNSLRVLEWWNYPSNSLPSDFHPKKLAIFNLPGSGLVSVDFVEKKKFMNLKFIKVDGSDIKQVPDVSGAPNLEELSFEDCGNLIEVHESVGLLKSLRDLGISGCSKLRSFPDLMLPSLEWLNFSGCSSLENFPPILGDMKRVRSVYLTGTLIKELPSSFKYLRKLGYLEIDDVHGMLGLPNNIATLSSLEEVKVSRSEGLQFREPGEDEGQWSSMVSSNAEYVCFANCKMLDETLATILALFRNVVNLKLSNNDFTFIPDSIQELCSLKRLYLDDCKKLEVIRAIPPNLKIFSAANCLSLSSSSKSMLLNKELHSSGHKYKIFHLPGSNFPEWFECKGALKSFSFWFRNKIPSISICVGTGPVIQFISNQHITYKLMIDGDERISYTYHFNSNLEIDQSNNLLTGEVDHITIFSTKKGKQIWKNEWCHAEYIMVLEPYIKKIGFHLHTDESNMEDVRFTKPLLPEKEVNLVDSLPLLEWQQEEVTFGASSSTNQDFNSVQGEYCLLYQGERGWRHMSTLVSLFIFFFALCASLSVLMLLLPPFA